jgi:hypothetical protein
MGGQEQAGGPVNVLGPGPELFQPCVIAAVLPADDGAEGLTASPVPADDVGTLCGQTGCGDIPGPVAQFLCQLIEAVLDGRKQFPGIVFDKRPGVGPGRGCSPLPPGCSEKEASATGSPLPSKTMAREA